VCPVVWPRGRAPEGVFLEIRCGGHRVDPGVDDPPLEENPDVGHLKGWGRVPFVGRGPQHRRRVLCGAEP
jgi:hypothetical protein